jgi:hypothetical protein
VPDSSSLASGEQSTRTLIQMRPQSRNFLPQHIPFVLSHARQYSVRASTRKGYSLPLPNDSGGVDNRHQPSSRCASRSHSDISSLERSLLSVQLALAGPRINHLYDIS